MIKTWFENEFLKGNSLWEKLFMVGMVGIQLLVFAINPESIISMIAGVAGVISVVMFAKGRLSGYFIGFIQTFTYLYLAWTNQFYGEVLENLFYFVTMVWGIFMWKNNMTKNDDGSEDVISLKFTSKMWIGSIIISTIGTIGMGYWLASIGSAQPYTDAATNIFAVIAQFLMVFRYREQWIWWLIIDLLCIKMWFVAGNWSMVAMYVAWTINTIYGWYNWSKLNKIQQIEIETQK